LSIDREKGLRWSEKEAVGDVSTHLKFVFDFV